MSVFEVLDKLGVGSCGVTACMKVKKVTSFYLTN
jgi:hypothetical protein